MNDTGDTPDDRREQIRNQLDDELAPIREHQEVFKRAASGELPGVGEDGAAIARVCLAWLVEEEPAPGDVAVMDAYGDRHEDGNRSKRKLASTDGCTSSGSRMAWAAERRWFVVRRVAQRFGIPIADLDASYGTEGNE